MANLSPLKRLYYTYLGYFYWFAYQTSKPRIFGLRPRTLILLLPIAALIYGWLARWDSLIMLLLALLLLALLLTYWRTGRAGYFRFVPAAEQALPEGRLESLPPNARTPLRATGSFSVSSREEKVLLQPAEYWQVPLGDHVLMVRETADRFLYQFFKAETLQTVRQGWLLHGPRPQRALAVSFLSSWGPEFDIGNRFYLMETADEQPKKQRTVYLSFDDERHERLVWHNIVQDARRVRSGE